MAPVKGRRYNGSERQAPVKGRRCERPGESEDPRVNRIRGGTGSDLASRPPVCGMIVGEYFTRGRGSARQQRTGTLYRARTGEKIKGANTVYSGCALFKLSRETF
jgi:hypothetical protein